MKEEQLKEALEIIRKFVNEFDEEGEVSYNTRDEAEIFLTKQQHQIVTQYRDGTIQVETFKQQEQ
jgi:ArsR family metal-binding transcriptional regulator